MNFTEYLEQKKYSERTVKTYNFYILSFLTWLESENLSPNPLPILMCLNICVTARKRELPKERLQYTLHHPSLLKLSDRENKRTDNPAAGVFIKGLVGNFQRVF